MEAEGLRRHIHELAGRHGFDRCGVAPAGPIAHRQYLRDWLATGQAGSMDYMYRYFNTRSDSRELLPEARSIIVAALSYNQRAHLNPTAMERFPVMLSASEASPAQSRVEGSEILRSAQNDMEVRRTQSSSRAVTVEGRIAMYAWGRDYHKLMKRKLFALVDELRATVDTPFEAKVCVDTAPLVEREFAALAGIGWIGKNTLVLHQEAGSYVFLGAVVTTLDIAPDQPAEDHCGTCTACLDACPTQAFTAPYQMDASRCISYLTIEHRGDISKPFQAMMGDWIFGCDVCQQVCPFNRAAPPANEPGFAARQPAPGISPEEVLDWAEGDYQSKLAGSAMKRATLDMWKRNARIVQENAQPK